MVLNANVEYEKPGLIKVFYPSRDQEIVSPLTIEGEARGTWFFEASFPVKLLDSRGRVIAQTPALAQADPTDSVGAGWMTEDYVPFRAVLIFSVPTSTTNGTLVLEKDNPSGDPSRYDELRIPVIFSDIQMK